MGHVLVVSSSLAGQASQSRALALEFAAAWAAAHSGVTVKERALSPETTGHLTRDFVVALGAPPEARSEAQSAAVAYSEELLGELEGAEAIVIASPMYTFTVSSTLKAWLEFINRPGRTFVAPEDGQPPRGLITGRKVVVVCTRGAVLTGTPLQILDHQEPFLRTILGFFGMEPTFVKVEGLVHGPDPEAAFAAGREAVLQVAQAAG